MGARSGGRQTQALPRRVSRGGLPPPPPLEIEKQKKGHQSKFEASSPIFGYFFSRKYHFPSHFLSWVPPPPKILKNQKKCFQILPPPLTNSWTRA